jgi:hypothetical protein
MKWIADCFDLLDFADGSSLVLVSDEDVLVLRLSLNQNNINQAFYTTIIPGRAI